MIQKDKKKICLISSSGGHYEQLKMLSNLSVKHNLFWVTEKADYSSSADYYLIQTGMKDKLFPLKMTVNFLKALKIWIIEKPDYIITTGAMVVLPMLLLAKVFKKKIIFIETFARVYEGTRTGKLMYKHCDLFIVQWEQLLEVYPRARYGGSLY